MFKIITAAALIALLSACSSMPGGSMSSSSGMSTQSMGASGSMNGNLDSGRNTGGPN